MPCVSILKTYHVTPSPGIDSNISTFQEKLSLSILDLNWLRMPYTQPLFLYPDTTVHSFPSIVRSLKSSLSTTLTKFYPFAGKIDFIQDTGDVIIDCTHCSVEFVEAECSVDIKQLTENDVHDTVMYMELVPEIDRSTLPIPAMAVKVTRFTGGGVAIGLAIHHAVADGNGKRMFYEAWSAVCRGDLDLFNKMVVLHDRKILKHPNDEEVARSFIKKAYPTLPFLGGRATPMEERLRLQRRTFMLSSPAIQSLKKRIRDELNEPQHYASTFTTIAAYIWVCLAKTNINSANDITALLYLLDWRSRVEPVITEYGGNCLRTGYADGGWSELRSVNGLSRAQVLIGSAIKKDAEGGMYSGEDKGFEKFRQTPESGRVILSRSNRLMCSQTDFGWGRPGRFEMAGLNCKGEVMLDGMGGGDVKVSIALEPDQMHVFAAVFREGLNP
uniref:Acyltransferase 1 n=1 Tax=Allium cepa TaxID=4679 RepID=A0A2H5AHW5_ALLCE|nr:acyltransferase 1 [Allium cepa]